MTESLTDQHQKEISSTEIFQMLKSQNDCGARISLQHFKKAYFKQVTEMDKEEAK